MIRLIVWSATVALAAAACASQQSTARQVAITFDDLPGASHIHGDVAFFERVNRDLVASLVRHRVPAIGFVNESKLAVSGATEPARVAVLKQWVDAGLELGNHTYSHADLHSVALDQFKQDTLRGDVVTRELLAATGKRPRYFRHPFLHTGRDAATRTGFEAFLKEHGYTVAPVTIDNRDYTFAAAYDRAVESGDAPQAERIASAYVGYMTAAVAYYEQQSQAILGREPRQVLMLHVNALNARTFDPLAQMFKEREYRFVTLDTALEDRAYGSRDEYYGPEGITWLFRWALTAGKGGALLAAPVVPDWIARAEQ